MVNGFLKGILNDWSNCYDKAKMKLIFLTEVPDARLLGAVFDETFLSPLRAASESGIKGVC